MIWSDARRRHAAIARAAEDDLASAKLIWGAVKGDDRGLEPDSYAEAVFDAAPAEFAGVLADGGTAAAYAVSCAWEHFWSAQTATPLERRDMARKAWATFRERAELAADVQYGLGWDASEAWEGTREVRLRKVNRDKLQRIAKMAGRMYAVLRGERATKVAAVPEEIYSVEMGADLARLLPSELVVLGTAYESLLYDKIADRKAFQYAVRGDGPAGRGPLVIALDESGSMHDSRQEWSKAVAVALTRMAHDDDRAVAVVHYSRSVTVRRLAPGDARGLADLIGHWLGGGTDIGLALRNAAHEVEELAREGDRGADVVLVTDGVDGRSDLGEAVEAVTAVQARLFTVAIECGIDEDNPLRSGAARYVEVGASDLDAGDVGALEGAVL